MVKRMDIKSAGALLSADVEGQGSCAILLHAGVGDRRMWQSALGMLSRNHLAIAYDRRGFGDTRTPDEPFRHIDDLDRVIAHFGCKSAILIACSQGGRVAIDYVLAHPGKVSALVLVASAVSGAPEPDDHPPEVARLMADLETAEESGDFDRMNRIEARFWLDGPSGPEGRIGGALRQLFLEMNGNALRQPALTRQERPPSAMAAIQTIDVPTLVIWGDRDFPHMQQLSSWIAATIPGAKSLVMKGCAHLPNLEQPARFNAAIEEFLARHRSAAA